MRLRQTGKNPRLDNILVKMQYQDEELSQLFPSHLMHPMRPASPGLPNGRDGSCARRCAMRQSNVDVTNGPFFPSITIALYSV